MSVNPERKSPTEALDLKRSMDDTWAGKCPVDETTYPYFSPNYRLPFTHIGTDKQLFLDNFILADFVNVKRVVVRPNKLNPPLIRFSNLPWERYHWTCVCAAALKDPDDGLFKMWYKTLVSGNTNSPKGTLVVLCYAESEDAIHWTKPLRSDCQPFENETKTNIVLTDFDNGTLVLNPDRNDPNKKFLAIYNPGAEAFRCKERVMSRVAASPDGIHWHVISDNTPFRHHHQMRVIWDTSLKKWRGYSQHSHAWSHNHLRTIGLQESDDFINWSPKKVILSSEWDPNLGPNVELHTMSIRKEGGLYIGIVDEAHGEHQWLLNIDGSNQHDQFHTKATLYVSRNGTNFVRADGYQPWCDNDEPGSQDYGYSCHSVAGFLLHNGQMVIPYSAFPHKQRDTRPAGLANHVPAASAQASNEHVESLTRHGIGNPMMNKVRTGLPLQRGIGGLVLREDGWAKLKPTYEKGQVYTTQFVFEGDSLKINAECDYGFIRVEILDPKFKPYKGFSIQECDPIHAPKDQIWQTVTWLGKTKLHTLWNKPVRLCFHLLEANLYAFQFFYSECE